MASQVESLLKITIRAIHLIGQAPGQPEGFRGLHRNIGSFNGQQMINERNDVFDLVKGHGF